ncbi:hypothetical protein B0A48_11589 [Cryoendolithus antarcticus]|uniref:Sec39 domain-containing protein n=1 Tax=Cryoendolithus antarcticus TaxID=1507870 RepID=A0A1V8SW07_9PEZI|nr:hypothetical protein B0A48_11589 [Cryoendolithus antarcticus]
MVTLSTSQCLLLTVHCASESNIRALHTFTPTRSDALDPELILRILLTYLPESLPPREYTSYVSEVASRLYLDVDREDVEVDVKHVEGLDEKEIEKRVKKVRKELRELRPSKFPAHAPDDILTSFLCHRAEAIDRETGLLPLVKDLVEPFLDRNAYLRTWYVSAVLPLLRLNWEYYPDSRHEVSIEQFAGLEGKDGIEMLMEKSTQASTEKVAGPEGNAEESAVGRDMKGLVGPWMYGHSERKRRKLNGREEGAPAITDPEPAEEQQLASGLRKIKLNGISKEDITGHDWEYAYRWMVHQATANFPLVTRLIDDWDGPSDVDFGGFESRARPYLDDDIQRKLELQYAQAAFASCYAVTSPSEATVRGAHGVLARLAELLDFIPPPDLATSVDSLPRIEEHTTKLDESHTPQHLEPDHLFTAEHPLTTPRMETYMLLQMIVYTAYQLLGLGNPMSLVGVAKLQFYGTAENQMTVLKRILQTCTKNGKGDEAQSTSDRAKLIWLWNWGIATEDTAATTGAGVLGKIEKAAFEDEILKVYLDTSCYTMISKLYLQEHPMLSAAQTEQAILAKALEAYDGASNGNRSRGGMRKASEIISTFRPQFPSSTRFRQVSALLAATHSLSFYSLTLQHGVPFQPVSIRVSQDPIGLLSKVLEQNPGSYTKLDDLIAIGQNLIAAGLVNTTDDDTASATSPGQDLTKQNQDADRRITLMAVESALREDDFETAYSYVVNRLTPSSLTPKESEDDTSWRAAFLAGRFRPTSSTPPSLRRLEQRTELLSLALLLAPKSALTDILSAWRRCEEEMTSLAKSQAAEEQEFDDHADKKQVLPGHFVVNATQPDLVLGQKRRELGRLASGAGGGKGEEAPVSMFDLTRSAAAALGRGVGGTLGGVGGLAGAGRKSTEMSRSGVEGAEEGDGVGAMGERVRRRDMVANAVSGGLASGLGWVLGATPAQGQGQGER